MVGAKVINQQLDLSSPEFLFLHHSLLKKLHHRKLYNRARQRQEDETDEEAAEEGAAAAADPAERQEPDQQGQLAQPQPADSSGGGVYSWEELEGIDSGAELRRICDDLGTPSPQHFLAPTRWKFRGRSFRSVVEC